MTQLLILVGTTTGTAAALAQTIELDCSDLVDAIRVLRMDGLGPEVFDTPALFLLCTATHGSGDVPDNAQAFYQALAEQPRYLGHVRYGLMALGDQGSYPQTFAGAGQRFDERLQDLGAQRLGPVWTHDASSGDDASATGLAWARQWLQAQLPLLAGGTGA